MLRDQQKKKLHWFLPTRQQKPHHTQQPTTHLDCSYIKCCEVDGGEKGKKQVRERATQENDRSDRKKRPCSATNRGKEITLFPQSNDENNTQQPTTHLDRATIHSCQYDCAGKGGERVREFATDKSYRVQRPKDSKNSPCFPNTTTTTTHSNPPHTSIKATKSPVR